jgi:hypothetical protein
MHVNLDIAKVTAAVDGMVVFSSQKDTFPLYR